MPLPYNVSQVLEIVLQVVIDLRSRTEVGVELVAVGIALQLLQTLEVRRSRAQLALLPLLQLLGEQQGVQELAVA